MVQLLVVCMHTMHVMSSHRKEGGSARCAATVLPLYAARLVQLGQSQKHGPDLSSRMRASSAIQRWGCYTSGLPQKLGLDSASTAKLPVCLKPGSQDSLLQVFIKLPPIMEF